MNTRITKQWIAALKSGDYKQGYQRLRTRDTFCCLGVLCNLHAQAHPEIAMKESSSAYYLGQDELLPQEVLTWAEMCYGNLGGSNLILMQMNDIERKNFVEIADFIKEHMKDL